MKKSFILVLVLTFTLILPLSSVSLTPLLGCAWAQETEAVEESPEAAEESSVMININTTKPFAVARVRVKTLAEQMQCKPK